MKKIILLVVLLALSGCQTYDMDFSELEDQKEGKLLGVMGVGLIVPGVEDYSEAYKNEIEVYVIPGTSDAIKNDRHLKYNKAAYRYALRHNIDLLKNRSQIQSEVSTPLAPASLTP